MGPFHWPDYDWVARFEAEKRARRPRLTPMDRMLASLEATFMKIAADQARERPCQLL